MKYRQLGDTELRISEVSFGTWAIGGGWGHANDDEALTGIYQAMPPKEKKMTFMWQRSFAAPAIFTI